ncbi:MAG: tetratricopeptide repeat protein [Desulfatibacillaceae bacterium]|nr:tetratricopeptide repeat protein [Desulfatibacillaceae bacterium]
MPKKTFLVLLALLMAASLVLPSLTAAQATVKAQAVVAAGPWLSSSRARVVAIAKAHHQILEQAAGQIKKPAGLEKSNPDLLALTAWAHGLLDIRTVLVEESVIDDYPAWTVGLEAQIERGAIKTQMEFLERNSELFARFVRHLEMERRLIGQVEELLKEQEKIFYLEKEAEKSAEDFQNIIDNAVNRLAALGLLRMADSLFYREAQYSNPQKAVEYYNAALMIDPELTLVHRGRGSAYLFLYEFEGAVDDFSRAIEADSSDSLSLLDRGVAYGELGMLDKAVADFDRAIEINPNLAQAWGARGFAFILSGELDKGCEFLKKACDLGECNYIKAARYGRVCR